jgi:uncharacterized Fe-S radical SAM superfamily protein PflX
MNKEAKEKIELLLKDLKLNQEESSKEYKSGLIEEMIKRNIKAIDESIFEMLIRENIELQQKVNQLETNKAEALEYIDTNYGPLETDDSMLRFYIEQIQEILERGKE